MKRNLIILLVIPILLISCGSDNYKDFMQNTLSENFKNTMCSFNYLVFRISKQPKITRNIQA